MINYKYLNKVPVRNLSKSSDKHDIIKMLLYRMIRRKYPKAEVYSEYPLGNEIPDIYYKLKKDIYVLEIQKEINAGWVKKIIDRYGDINLEIIETKKISNNINEMKEQLKEFI